MRTPEAPMKWSVPLLLAVALVLSSPPARAQFAPGGPNEPDTPLDAATRAAVIESLAVAVRDFYVFPDKGTELAKALRRRASQKQYDRITSSRVFAESLTAHMQATTHDLHMRVQYRQEKFGPGGQDHEPSEHERVRTLAFEQVRNFGFEQVRRLPGNVGYLDLRMFSGSPEAQATAIAAMNFLGNCDALIVDLRRNGGGSPGMIQTLLTYLVEPGRRLNFNNFYQRQGDRWEQWHTASYVPGARLAGKPVYVLTSVLTGSAAEEFSYDIQTHKLGTLVGATTYGAANPGRMVRLSDHFAAFVATGRAVNPITNTNWEGVGVKPDVSVPAHEALRTAHVRAIETLQEKPRDEQHRALLGRALDAAKQTPLDKPEDFELPKHGGSAPAGGGAPRPRSARQVDLADRGGADARGLGGIGPRAHEPRAVRHEPRDAGATRGGGRRHRDGWSEVPARRHATHADRGRAGPGPALGGCPPRGACAGQVLLDPAHDRVAVSEQRHIGAAHRPAEVHADRCRERSAAVARAHELHAARVLGCGEPRHRHFVRPRRDRRTVHGAARDPPAVGGHAQGVAPLARLPAHEVDVAHLPLRAVAIRHDDRVTRARGAGRAALARARVQQRLGAGFGVPTRGGSGLQHRVAERHGLSGILAVGGHAAAVEPERGHAALGPVHERDEAVLAVQPVAVRRDRLAPRAPEVARAREPDAVVVRSARGAPEPVRHERVAARGHHRGHVRPVDEQAVVADHGERRRPRAVAPHAEPERVRARLAVPAVRSALGSGAGGRVRLEPAQHQRSALACAQDRGEASRAGRHGR